MKLALIALFLLMTTIANGQNFLKVGNDIFAPGGGVFYCPVVDVPDTNWSLNFDGANDYVTVSNIPGIAGLHQFSVVSWLNIPNHSGTPDYLSSATGLNPDYNFRLNLNAGRPFFTFYNDEADNFAQGNAVNTVPTNEWFMLIQAFDFDEAVAADVVDIYTNDMLSTSFNLGGDWPANHVSSNQVLIEFGGNSWLSGFRQMQMDDTYFLSFKVTATQATNLYAAGRGIDPAITLGSTNGILGFWEFGDPLGTNTFPSIPSLHLNGASPGVMKNMGADDFEVGPL